MGVPHSDLGLPSVDGVYGALLKMVLPVVAFIAIAPVIWVFFRRTWREIDAEATDRREEMRAADAYDYRPVAVFAITALILTAQEYYGGSRFFGAYVRPWLRDLELEQMASPGGLAQYIDTRFYGELYSYAWWAGTRILGYTVIPLAAWKLLFPKDSLLDMGLRTKGVLSHAWIYGMCLLVVIPCVVVVAQNPEFANYYPFYKLCSRSWLDLLVWEAMYIAQFFALEVFFRGFMLTPLKGSLGTGAIFAMCVPYVMIHFGKPYLEASVAFIAGVALGSLSMRTKSIYSGFFVHVTVAILMDTLAIMSGRGFPSEFWPR
jgi:membrane protease YdiL (CAAX protease family)